MPVQIDALEAYLLGFTANLVYWCGSRGSFLVLQVVM